MADNTPIEWTDATVNFWWGCTKVGPGCDHCYAEPIAKRFGGNHWGTGVPRKKIKTAAAKMRRLDNDYSWWAADCEIGRLHPHPRRRVFVQSMSDLFDTEAPLDWFNEAWKTISACDRIDVQILTKRISVVYKRLTEIGATSWPLHAGLMISVTSQAEADRDIPRLLTLFHTLNIPWIGLSCEPLLGNILLPQEFLDLGPRAWVIAGGESGPNARPMHPDWARSLRDQCVGADMPFFFKQWGAWAAIYDRDRDDPDWRRCSEIAQRTPRGRWMNLDGGHGFHGNRVVRMDRIGKAKSGRILDGRTWDQMPGQG